MDPDSSSYHSTCSAATSYDDLRDCILSLVRSVRNSEDAFSVSRAIVRILETRFPPLAHYNICRAQIADRVAPVLLKNDAPTEKLNVILFIALSAYQDTDDGSDKRIGQVNRMTAAEAWGLALK